MACATGKDKCNQEDCGVCYPLTYAIVNDVVYYIYHYSDRATLDYIVMGCELTFSDPDTIVEAKKELLVKVQDELIKINKPLADEVAKERRGGIKSKASMVITDIYNALKALGPSVDVKPVNADKISNVKPGIYLL